MTLPNYPWEKWLAISWLCAMVMFVSVVARSKPTKNFAGAVATGVLALAMMAAACAFVIMTGEAVRLVLQ